MDRDPGVGGLWALERRDYLLFASAQTFSQADDLGLQIGMQRLKRLEARPNRKVDLPPSIGARLRRDFLILAGTATLDEKPAPAA
jgi:hypothetical protein